MRRLASTQISPQAQTAVVVGAIDGVPDLDLRSYRSVLWFTRESAAEAGRFELGPGETLVESVKNLDAPRTLASIDNLIRRDALHLPSVFVSDEVLESGAPAFAPVIDAIFAQFESHQRARTTRQADGFLWQSQLLANLPAYARRRVPRTWAGALAGLPAFICGAGPSLDASLPQLKIFADDGVIFAADTALKALAHAGVTADFAVSVDARKASEKCLTPGHPSAGRVIVAGISPPAWQYSVAAGKLHFLSGRQLTEDALGRMGVGKSPVMIEENCGITALSLALHLGCGPIYLFGMDHAVDGKAPMRWHQQHADPTLELKTALHANRPLPKVPGNYQEEIATPLFREWRALDARCAGLPPEMIFNVTDRGARLRNTTVLPPEHFVPAMLLGEKATRLDALGAPDAFDETTWADARAAFHALADRAGFALAAARLALEGRDVSGVARHLGGLFRDPAFALLFGNYSLKLMPHLVRPERTPHAAWRPLLLECEELVDLARNLR